MTDVLDDQFTAGDGARAAGVGSAAAVAEIDLAAYRHNLARARRAAGSRRVWAVLKGDAYGHGAATLARAGSADGFALAHLDEALALRASGLDAALLAMQGALVPEDYARAAAAGVTLAVHDPAQIDMLEPLSALPARLPLWLKVDTGMHRLGVAPEHVEALLARLQARGDVCVTALMSHLACADVPRHDLNADQLEAFEAVCAGRRLDRSVCNSAALLGERPVADEMVRPGIMLYGASPLRAHTAAALGLEPVMRLTAPLLSVKMVARGGTVGYGADWQLREATRIGLVGFGYGDGYPRHAPSGTPVIVRGQRVGTLGRVSMDSLAIDLAAVPEARVGDVVELWGPRLPVDTVAERVGTIAYELLTKITQRVPRRYIDAEA